MKKNFFIFILIIILLLGCLYATVLPTLREKQGVSESLVYEYLCQKYSNPHGYAIQSLNIQNYTHKIDPKLHRDDIIVVSELQYNYLTSVNTDSLTFQYDKSSDTWSLLENHSSSQNIYNSPKEELIGTLWQGTCQPPFRKETKYTIYVEDIDYMEGAIYCSYYLSNDDFKKSGTAIVHHTYDIDTFYTIYFDYNEGLLIG